jgi:hypothetical protein
MFRITRTRVFLLRFHAYGQSFWKRGKLSVHFDILKMISKSIWNGDSLKVSNVNNYQIGLSQEHLTLIKFAASTSSTTLIITKNRPCTEHVMIVYSLSQFSALWFLTLFLLSIGL